MNVRDAWRLALHLAIDVAIGLAGGALIGRPAAGVAVVLAADLVLQSVRLGRLVRWIGTDKPDEAPNLPGRWGALVTRISRLQRRKRFHRQRLLRLLRELRRSTAALPDGVVMLNPQLGILWCNRTAARLLGLRGKADAGLRIEHLVRYPEFVHYLNAGQYAMPVHVRAGADGEQHLSLQLVPYGAGQRLLLVRDVTHAVRVEAMRRDFVANASHELRSPLTVIWGYLETLDADPTIEPPLAGLLREMRRQAQRMKAIVQDLLELSRLESSDPDAALQPVDVAALMAQLRQDVLSRPGHPQQVQIRADSQAWLLGEPIQIHSAFANLLDNAVKYTPPEGSIQMRWWVNEQGGHFSVRDTGIGIAPEHLPRLTERFYRVDGGRSRSTGGSGLGLAIVKHVLQRHGAQLSIQSEPGRGSEFICHFPPGRIREPEVATEPGAVQAARV